MIRIRENPEFLLIRPLLHRLPVSADLFCVENIELGLLSLEQESWNKLITPSIVEGEDGNVITGDPLIDEMERRLAKGESLDELLK